MTNDSPRVDVTLVRKAFRALLDMPLHEAVNAVEVRGDQEALTLVEALSRVCCDHNRGAYVAIQAALLLVGWNLRLIIQKFELEEAFLRPKGGDLD